MIAYNLYDLDVLESVIGESKFYNFKEAAALINKKGLGRNNLLKLLREKGLLGRFNHPVNGWASSGFFKVMDDRYETPLISTYGINYIKRKFL